MVFLENSVYLFNPIAYGILSFSHLCGGGGREGFWLATKKIQLGLIDFKFGTVNYRH